MHFFFVNLRLISTDSASVREVLIREVLTFDLCGLFHFLSRLFNEKPSSDFLICWKILFVFLPWRRSADVMRFKVTSCCWLSSIVFGFSHIYTYICMRRLSCRLCRMQRCHSGSCDFFRTLLKAEQVFPLKHLYRASLSKSRLHAEYVTVYLDRFLGVPALSMLWCVYSVENNEV